LKEHNFGQARVYEVVEAPSEEAGAGGAARRKAAGGAAAGGARGLARWRLRPVLEVNPKWEQLTLVLDEITETRAPARPRARPHLPWPTRPRHGAARGAGGI